MVEYFVGLTLLLGGESLLADRAISEIIKGDPTATVTQLTAGEFETGAISDALAPSLFGENRIIVIREINDLTADLSEEVSDYLEAPDEGVHLVLWHKGGIKGKALLDKVKKLKPTTIACDILKKDSEKVDFVRAEFSRLRRKASTEAIQALIDSLGSDLRELSGAISQLACDTAPEKIIDEVVVAKFQQGRIETSGYDVADAAIDGNREAALVALRNALDTGTDPVLITSALAGSLRTLAKVSGATRGMKSFDLASSLGLPPWQIDKARRQLGKWTPATLAGAVVAVAQADADIKGAAVDPIHSLERAIIAITARV
jgi:DNA polymerase III subunit delta